MQQRGSGFGEEMGADVHAVALGKAAPLVQLFQLFLPKSCFGKTLMRSAVGVHRAFQTHPVDRVLLEKRGQCARILRCWVLAFTSESAASCGLSLFHGSSFPSHNFLNVFTAFFGNDTNILPG